MKGSEELQMLPADVAAITPTVIAGEIEEIARGVRVFVPLFRENRDLIGDGKGRTINFPTKRSGIVFQKVPTPLTDLRTLTIGKIMYSSIPVTVEKWGGIVQIARETLDQGQRDIIKETLYEAGEDWAEVQDVEARDTLFGATDATGESHVSINSTQTNFTLTNSPILAVSQVRIGASAFTVSCVNYYTGVVQLDVAVASGDAIDADYVYSTRSLVQDAGTKQSLGFRDLILARNKSIGANYRPGVGVLHENEIATLMFDTNLKFLDVSAYGSRETILNAEIGKIGGMKIISTTRTFDGVAVYLDTRRMGRHVIKRVLESTRVVRPEIDGIEYDMWADFKFAVINPSAIAISVNHASDAYAL